MAADESETRADVDELIDWFKSKGGWLNPSVEIVHNESHGFHMRAMEPLLTPFTVITCPLSLTLSFLNLDPNQASVPHVASPLQGCLGKLPEHVLNYLLLIEQLVLEDSSPWYPYINCLPDQDELSTALWFDSSYFESTPVPQAKQERLNILKKEHKNAMSAMKKAGMSGSDTYNECDFETFLWAATIMSSRAFTSSNVLPELPSFPILFPVIDIANHAVTNKVRWEYPDSKAFSLRVLDPVNAGSEVFNNYGPKQNAELLLGYGFAIPDNPVEQVAIKLGLPDDMLTDIKPEHVPFGMDMSSLVDPAAGLRTQNNLLGRYNNAIPFFRGFPPVAVFASYAQALHVRGLELDEFTSLGVPVPGRLVMATLLFLYKAIQDKCARLPYLYTPVTSFDSAGEQYAYIYRVGQVKICHTMRRELKTVLEKLRIQDAAMEQPPDAPAILTFAEALLALRTTFPLYYEDFTSGMKSLFGIDVEDAVDIAKDRAEERMWVFLLIVFATVSRDNEDSLVSRWMQDLRVVSACQDPKFEHNIRINGRDADDYDEYLEKLGGQGDSVWAKVARREMRKNMVAWALQVVHCEVFAMADHLDKSMTRHCMYMHPWQSGGSGEKWMFEEVNVLEQEPEGEPDIKVFANKFN